ncbi:MAG: hypothetical protein AB7O59_14025 [Pirellulales bacterium]
MSRSLYFFATKQDVESLIAAVEAHRDLLYVRAGMSDDVELVSFTSGLHLPGLGVATVGDWNREPWWLIVDRTQSVELRSVLQRRGGTRHAIDQILNPASVAFEPGGLHCENVIIAGQVGTCTDDPTSKDLVNLFAREIRRHFKRIRSFFVGPQAEEMLDAGCRLTTSIKSSKDYDLFRP